MLIGASKRVLLQQIKVKKERFETRGTMRCGDSKPVLSRREGELFSNYFAIASITRLISRSAY